MEHHKFLITQYEEAGRQCIRYSRLVLQNMNLFIPMQTFVTGFVLIYAESLTFRFLGLVLGIVLAVFAITTDIRSRRYYEVYRDQAIRIEQTFGLEVNLFEDARAEVAKSRTIASRYMYPAVFVVFVVTQAVAVAVA